jgi:hypothetical protein
MNSSLRRVFEVYVFAFLLVFASRPLSDGDFWFHLKTGEYIFATGQVPKQELFSFTSFGTPWIAHGWLAGAIFYAIYSKLGFYPLIFLFSLLAALAFWIVFKRSPGHPLIRGLATLLGAWAVLPNLGVRPRVFSLLLASVFLLLLKDFVEKENRKAVWWLVPLMVLWVNLHGGFLIGLLLIAFTLVGIPLDAWTEGKQLNASWPRLQTLGLVLIACVGAVAINPYGVRMYALPLDVMRTPIFQSAVIDFLSPDFHQREIFPFALLSLLTVAALALSPKRVRPSQLLLFLATFYSALQTQRNILIFALVAAPLFAEHFQSWLDSSRLARVFKAPNDVVVPNRGSVALSLLLLLPLLLFAIQLKRKIYVAPTQETSRVPMKAVEYMREHQITGNTITIPNIWGGYLIWALPSNPVYIDGRNAYPQEFVEEYVDIAQGLKDWRAPFSRYGVKNAIVSRSSLLYRELSESKDWEKVYEDELAVVFTKR